LGWDDGDDQQEQGVIFPAGTQALSAGNPSISQEIMTKPPSTAPEGRNIIAFNYLQNIMLFIS
jgi:hypothetical protein